MKYLLLSVCFLIQFASFGQENIKTSDTVTVTPLEYDVSPEFSGGNDALDKYLKDNLKYPEFAKKNGISGNVFVSFDVDIDGTIRNVILLRGLEKNCDSEAIRLVQSMPKWKPAILKGKPIIYKFTLPIKFKL
ncbi:MAG: energy transducer TonB [Bacteroidota bacterium]